MKKNILFAALAVMVGASSIQATVPGKKKQKDNKQPAPVEAVKLTSGCDSLNYAAGVAFTDGLKPFLESQLKVDTAYMADFERGMKEAIAKKDDKQFKAYAAGFQVAEMLNERMVTGLKNELKDSPDSVNTALLQRGFFDAIEGSTQPMDMKSATEYFKKRREEDAAAKQEKLYGENRRAGEAFLAANAKKDSVVTLPSGVQYKVLVQGTGEKPKATDKVTVKYEGKTIDGKVFDSSYKRKPDTTTFGLNQVIKGWTEGLEQMPVGSTYELYIPYQMGYGERGAGNDIKPFSALIFKVELISIGDNKEKKAEEKKEDTAATAKKTTTAKKTSTTAKKKK